jgi:uncharacterized membrane protein
MTRRILVIGILAATVAFAQRGGGGGGGRGGGGGGMSGGGIGFAATSKLDRIEAMLKLDKDQKKALKQTFDDAQKEATPVHEQLNKARLAIGDAVAAGKSQEEVAKAVSAEAAVQVQMTTIELGAFAKVVQALDEEQQKRASQLFAMMRGLFSNKNWNAD